MKTTLTGIIEKEVNMYTALCPELNVASQGYTIDEARKNLVEALELFLECADEDEVNRRLAREAYIPPLESISALLAGRESADEQSHGEMYVTPIEMAYG